MNTSQMIAEQNSRLHGEVNKLRSELMHTKQELEKCELAHLAGLEYLSKYLWRNANDSSPEPNQKCLCLNSYDALCEYTFINGKGFCEVTEDDQVWDVDDSVTHWIPTPERPQE